MFPRKIANAEKNGPKPPKFANSLFLLKVIIAQNKGVLKRYPQVGDSPKKVLSNSRLGSIEPPKGSIEPPFGPRKGSIEPQ